MVDVARLPLRRLSLPACLAAALAAAGAAGAAAAPSQPSQPPRPGSAADSVRALDAAWARAYATHDTALAHALFADDILVTSSGGAVKTKQGELADVRPLAGLQMAYFRTEQVDVRVHAAAAVAGGLAQWEFTMNGRTSTLRRRYTATYVRGGPLGWRMVALHLGPAPAP
jgi:ketosteroid isomerase-like protein